jgi:hypothetical protein
MDLTLEDISEGVEGRRNECDSLWARRSRGETLVDGS